MVRINFLEGIEAMLRQKQRIVWLATALIACLILYILYSRSGGDSAIKGTSQLGASAQLEPPAAPAAAAAAAVDSKQEQKQQQQQQPTEKHHVPVPESSGSNELQTIENPEPTKNYVKCKIYNEFRNIDFKQASLADSLCSGVKAYVSTESGYPMCKLPSPFNEKLIGIVSQGSQTAELIDMANKSVKMFVYPEKDYISETIKKTHNWEPALVHTTLKFAQLIPNATFLDAGCNIGVYSILAARLGLPVVSLDANIRNLLRLRLTLSSASLDAALVWNFIGSGDELSFLNFPGDCNVGGATKFGRAVRDTIPVMPVRSERLCDLISTTNVVIKLDVEGGEADFLRTSGRLFSHFKVAAVQMEFLKRHMVGNDSAIITQFFISRGYSAWRTPGLSELDTKSYASWGDMDLMWIHSEFKHLLSSVK